MAEGVAAFLEVGELVEGGTGRRQQHHRIVDAIFQGLAAGLTDGRRQIAGLGEIHLAGEGLGESVRRLADKEGMAHLGQMFVQHLHPALLEAAAGDPVDGVIAGQSLGGGVRIGRLAVVDVRDAVDGGDQLLAVSQPRKAADGGGDFP